MAQQDPAAEDFTAKWRRRWPEWGIAEAFVPASQREIALAWLSLQNELAEAAWGGEDPTPGLAKLAWWHEELEGWAKGGRRHPLGASLQRLPAPWTGLARALSVLPSTRGQDAATAQPVLANLADALDVCEAGLFGEAEDRGEPAADATTSALLAARALLTGSREDAGWLLERWPRGASGSRPGRLHRALLRARLLALQAGRREQQLSGWRVLGASWSAVRGS
ncbi:MULTISPECIES: phytoene/squalene synthase family protein [unclassified Luteimonas]